MEGGRICVFRLVVACLFPIVALSCGENGKDSESVQREEQIDEGSYEVTLSPVNPGLTEAWGLGKLIISDEQLYVKLALKGLMPGVLSRQHVHSGSRCPDGFSDLNGDGIVDEVEGFQSFGEVLLALSSNLNIHDYDTNTYPRSSSSGRYVYEQRGERRAVMEALTRDLTPEDRVVVIYGVPDSIVLPPSAKAYARGSVQSSIPVACGVIRRKETAVVIPERTLPQPRIPPELPPSSREVRAPNPRDPREDVSTTPSGETSPDVAAPREEPPLEKPPEGDSGENHDDNEDPDDDDLDDLRVLLEDVVGGIGDSAASDYGNDDPNGRR